MKNKLSNSFLLVHPDHSPLSFCHDLSFLNSHLKLLSILYFFWETFGKSVIVYFKMIHIKRLSLRAYSLNSCNPDYISINACVWIGKHDMGWMKLIRWKCYRYGSSSCFWYHMFYKYLKILISNSLFNDTIYEI